MNGIFQKRTLRDFKHNFFRYFALMLLVSLSMFIIISFAGAADSISEGSKKWQEETNVEDGQFEVFTPLSKADRKQLENAGAELQEMFYIDVTLDDGSCLRVFKIRENMDKIALVDNGKQATKDGEVLLEKRYATENGLQAGDTIVVGEECFTITGIGAVPDYDAPHKNLSDTAVDSKLFGLLFVTEKDYERLLNAGVADTAQTYLYAYKLHGLTDKELEDKLKDFMVEADEINDPYFQEYWAENGQKVDDFIEGIDELYDGAKELKEGIEKLKPYNDLLNHAVDTLYDGADALSEGTGELRDYKDEIQEYLNTDIYNLKSFTKKSDNIRINAAADDQVINKNAAVYLGIILIALFAYVISVFIVHSIEQESSIIGTLYALGVKRKELLVQYLSLPVCVTFLGGVLGFFMAMTPFGIRTQILDSEAYFSTPSFPIVCGTYIFIYALVMPPVVAIVVNYVVIRRKLSKPALSMIRNEAKQPKGKKIKLKSKKFVTMFRIRQMLREARTGFTVVLGIFISLLCLMLALDILVYCLHIRDESREDTKFAYMYTYKYPVGDAPQDGYEAYGKTMLQNIYGYELETTLLGITDENPFFDTKLEKGMNKVTLSSAVASKFNLKVGDRFILKDKEGEREYAFTVTDITQYAAGMLIFMDIDSMRELFSMNEDYYNVVFSGKDLHIDGGYLYATLTREDIYDASSIFIEHMISLIITITVVSVLIVCIVMYLMMKVMVDRAAFGIALIKVFGFRKKEVRKMYLNGNFYIVALGTLISVPLSKYLMDLLYPSCLVANTGASVNLQFDWWLYLVIYAGILLFYFIVNCLLTGKLDQILPAEVLKNRE